MKKRIRTYLDTSVIGGVYDDEFKLYSLQLFDQIKTGIYSAVISGLTLDELEIAPDMVKKVLTRIPINYLEIITITTEMKDLAALYIEENIVSPTFQNDAIHIAAATVNKVDFLVSWNFKHIVNFRKIHLYNSVNLKNDYQLIEIYSPREVIDYEN